MSRSYKHNFYIKEHAHCGSNKWRKRRANHIVRQYHKLNVHDARELWRLENMESIDEDWLVFFKQSLILRDERHYNKMMNAFENVTPNKTYKKMYESWNISDYKVKFDGRDIKRNYKYLFK